MKLWKYSGTLLMATGGLHLLVAVESGWDTWREIFSDGLANSIGKDAGEGIRFLVFYGRGIAPFLGKYVAVLHP